MKSVSIFGSNQILKIVFKTWTETIEQERKTKKDRKEREREREREREIGCFALYAWTNSNLLKNSDMVYTSKWLPPLLKSICDYKKVFSFFIKLWRFVQFYNLINVSWADYK